MAPAQFGPPETMEERRQAAARGMQDALEGISGRSIGELKSLGKPPKEVVLVCSAVGYLLGAGEQTRDWKSIQRMMSNPQAFLLRVRALDSVGLEHML